MQRKEAKINKQGLKDNPINTQVGDIVSDFNDEAVLTKCFPDMCIQGSYDWSVVRKRPIKRKEMISKIMNR